MKKLVALTLAGSLALGLFLTGCSVEQVSSEPNETVSSSENSANTGDRVLNVCNWGEYIDESLITQFEEETGIKVNYQTAESNEALYSLLKSGGANYDVICPSDYMISQLIEEDMLQPLDYS